MKREFDPLEEKISEVMQSIGGTIDTAITSVASKYGFALFVFELGGGRLNFVSNADRKSLIAAMKEFIAHSEAILDRPPPPRR